jgi:hypothetical protein
MGKIVSNFFISLDGVVESPEQWHFHYFDDAMGRVIEEGMQAQPPFLLGRRLYDEWSRYCCMCGTRPRGPEHSQRTAGAGAAE